MRFAISDSGKTEALADCLETQIQPWADLSVPAVVEMVDVPPRSYFLTPADEPNLTNHDEVHETIIGLTVRKSPNPNGIANRA